MSFFKYLSVSKSYFGKMSQQNKRAEWIVSFLDLLLNNNVNNNPFPIDIIVH